MAYKQLRRHMKHLALKFISVFYTALILSLSPDHLIARETAACVHELAELSTPADFLAAMAEDIFLDVCIKNVPPHFRAHPQFFVFARDPDQAKKGGLGRVSKQSIREAMAAIHLERSGMVPGPISRPLTKGIATDFVDQHGNGFDIKAFSSRRDPAGKDLDLEFVLANVQKKLHRVHFNLLTREVSPIHVYMDLTWLNTRDRAAVQLLFKERLSPQELSRIHYFELPEPQEKFRPKD